MNGKQKTLFQSWGSSLAPDTKDPRDPKPLRSKVPSKGKAPGSVRQPPPWQGIGGVSRGAPGSGRQPHQPPPWQGIGKAGVSRGAPGSVRQPHQPPPWQGIGKAGVSRGAPGSVRQPHQPPPCQDDDEDDDVLLIAVYEAEKSLNQTTNNKPSGSDGPQRNPLDPNPLQTPNFDQNRKQCPSKALNFPQVWHTLGQDETETPNHTSSAANGQSYAPTSTAPTHQISTSDIQNLPGFDLSAGDVWIYPTNYPVRDYQFNIAHTALLHNTLVCLPTGLGKTFIAAVVMYNFYRWYPSGKIVFMAPTKPLVAQQIEACFKIMGIPQSHMVEMTGSVHAKNRKEIWKKHRIFFLTPQIMVNDLSREACPASEIKCLVIDEAHKSQGNHAYCQVVRELLNYTKQFRILALSATPGSDTKSVQQVVSNLLIAHIELRSEDSPDIQSYSHERQVEKFVVPLGAELEVVQRSYLKVLETFAGRLIQSNVLSNRDLSNLTKYQMILSRDQFRKNPPPNIVGVQHGVVEGDFALCISLYHGYELLFQMGTRSLYYYLRSIMDGSKGMTRARNELSRNSDFMEIFGQLEILFSVPGGNGSLHSNTDPGSGAKKPFVYSHPKLKKLEEVVVQHFNSWNSCEGSSSSKQIPKDTRIMIFSSFRDSVQEIAELLEQHHPTVRVMTFVGHSSTGKGVKGFTQKEQLEVVRRFRDGGYNTLVSTCVGEEGLDIGEVDLIICFDAQKSPIRLVQRMGRTGRKRQGRIVVLLCKGREERTYNQSQSSMRSIYKTILGNKTLHLSTVSPRMVPDGLNPKPHKMFITQTLFETKDSTRPFSKDRRSSLGHRKSAVTCNREDAATEDGCLTRTEFETWNRLYRLQESDGITDVVLPKNQFEIFKDPKDTTKVEPLPGTVRELSLTEWKVWQNRPFPTDFVDHSDRCRNFVAVMEMIELMRLEEANCSYDIKMMCYFNKEDVERTTTTKETLQHSAANSKPTKKLSSSRNAKTCKKTYLSVFEPDEDFISSSKSNNVKKSSKPPFPSGESTETLVHTSRSKSGGALGLECGNFAIKDAGVLEGFRQTDKAVLQPRTTNMSVSDLCEQLPSRSEDIISKPQTPTDFGFQGFGAGSFDLLTMFHDLQSPANHDVSASFDKEGNCQLENLLSCVKLFLSRSPPSISEFDLTDLVEEMGEEMSYLESAVSPKKRQLKAGPAVTVPIKNSEVQIENSLVEMSDESKHLQGVPCKQARLFFKSDEDPHKRKTDTYQHSAASRKESQVKSITPVTEPLDGPKVQKENCAIEVPHDRNESQVVPCKQTELFTESKSEEGPYESKTDVAHQEGFPNRETLSMDSNANDGEDDGNKSNFEWDYLFDSEETPVDTISNAGSPTDLNSKEESLAGEKANGKLVSDHLEVSIELFDDDLFCDIDLETCKDVANSPLKGTPAVTFNICDPSVLFQDQPEQDDDFLSPDNIGNQADENKFDGSEELYSVNFDLGFSISDLSEGENSPNEGSETECDRQTPPKPFKFPSPPNRSNTNVVGGNMSTPMTPVSKGSAVGHLSLCSPLWPVTSRFSLTPHKPVCSSFLTPRGKMSLTPLITLTSPVKHKLRTPMTPKTSERFASFPTHPDSDADLSEMGPPRTKSDLSNTSVTIGSSSDSEEEVAFTRKRKLTKGRVLRSPETASSECDFDSPIPAVKKRKTVFTTRIARQFIDNEAELSSEGAEFVSSDEDVNTDNEENTSLLAFLDDNSLCLDSEMHCVYLKSLRSPALGNRRPMVGKKKNNMAIFSQIPEQDESYEEDSFCVEDDEELQELLSDEEVGCDLEALQQDSFIGGRKQYCTRRRAQLKGVALRQTIDTRPIKKKTRIVVLDDSSEEDTGLKQTMPQRAKPSLSVPVKPSYSSYSTPIKGPSTPVNIGLRDRCQARINLKASLSEVLDFQPESKSVSHIPEAEDCTTMSNKPHASSPAMHGLSHGSTAREQSLIILADSREISSGPEVISCMRTAHSVKVEVCSLGSCDYIVSNRLAVERKAQSDLLSSTNKCKLVDRVTHLQNVIQRVCLIVEKDRVKAGETSKIFQRTKYYDMTLSALISVGVQILFSSSQEETARLLKELASLEDRKKMAITVPTDVTRCKQEALQFYLSFPNMSYITALNLCHHFESVKQMVNSSVEEIARRGRVSGQKAEEIYRYFSYIFEPQMLTTDNAGKKQIL
ncbi:Fanconi anemia group M protein [Pelodytes ibericus]